MLEVDENLIRAAERCIDGGKGHHHYGTIHRYRAAAREGDTKAFESAELSLRSWVTFRAKELMPDSYRKALEVMFERINTAPVPCQDCGKPRLHGQPCKGTRSVLGAKGEPCWTIRDACEGCGDMCCGCFGKVNKEGGCP